MQVRQAGVCWVFLADVATAEKRRKKRWDSPVFSFCFETFFHTRPLIARGSFVVIYFILAFYSQLPRMTKARLILPLHLGPMDEMRRRQTGWL